MRAWEKLSPHIKTQTVFMVMRFLMRKQWGTAPKLSKETRSQNLKNFMLQSSALLSLNSNSFVISSTEAEN